MCMTFKLPTPWTARVVAARSMEFPMGMPTQLAVLPAGPRRDRHRSVTAAAPRRGRRPTGSSAWASSATPDWLVDGLNTSGVSAHLLYMPGGYCSFRRPRGDGSDLAQLDLAAYLLGTCASIAEVKAAVAGST